MKKIGTSLLMVAMLLAAGGIFTASGIAYAQCPPTTTGNDVLVNDGNCADRRDLVRASWRTIA